ncbi:hypothetical protein BDV93DRAFT_522997 [Ceratobasidium sp. AG-I]|nr:hypothetical protein BDV93DRAFT_522997 [Ceratobasidium sp. AG-I]
MSRPNGPRPVLASKDFSSFSANQAKMEARNAKNEDSKRVKITALLTTTEEHIKTANSVVQNASNLTDSFKVTKQVVSTLLAPAKDLVDLLGAVSEIHPAIGVVAGVFKAIIRLEMDRQENDRQIALLYNAMSNMLIVLAYTDEIFARRDNLHALMDQKLSEIVGLINEFGNFCDVYYKHRSIVRFLRSGKYKEMLTGFAQNFVDMKRDLESLVSQRTALTVHKTSDAVKDVAANVSQLVAFMEIQTTREREAGALVAAKGGLQAVLKDDKLLGEVAQKLGDQINSSVQYSLRQDLDQQLKANHLLFNIKIEAVQEQISETVKRSTAAIIMNLEAGPHELIHDPDIKAIWKDMKWRNTAKCRHFVSAVHHHYEQTFIRYAHENGSPHPDLWTLNYLSRVIFYPAIGDAIDEDGSGYVSLHELNHFFDSRPTEWTVPQWIAYWAAGWYRNNLRYRDKIMSRLRFLENLPDSMHVENKDALKEYIESVKPGIERIVESLYDDSLDYFDDDSAETTEMDQLQEKFEELVTKEVEEQLAKSKYELDDKRMLMLVVGSTRLESRLLCIMHRLLKRHHKIFDLGKDKPLQSGVTVAMTNTWQVIFDAFLRRMRALTESWRQQRMDIELQAQWYANGLFEDWYKQDQAESDSEDEYDEYSDDDDDDDAGTEEDENEFVEYATRPPTAVTDDGSVAGQIYQGAGDDHAQSDVDKHDQVDYDHEAVDGESSAFEAQHPAAMHSPALEERMVRLEEKVDDLRELMMQIIRQMAF